MPEHSERDREKLVGFFEEWGLQQYVPFHTERDMLADYLIANGVTGGWIPVRERMPEKSGQYLVYAHGYVGMVQFDVGTDTEICFWTHEVTHWMPLPEPPKINK